MNDDDLCCVCSKFQFTSPNEIPELFVKCAVCMKMGKLLTSVDRFPTNRRHVSIPTSSSQLYRDVLRDGEARVPVFVAVRGLQAVSGLPEGGGSAEDALLSAVRSGVSYLLHEIAAGVAQG